MTWIAFGEDAELAGQPGVLLDSGALYGARGGGGGGGLKFGWNCEVGAGWNATAGLDRTFAESVGWEKLCSDGDGGGGSAGAPKKGRRSRPSA